MSASGSTLGGPGGVTSSVSGAGDASGDTALPSTGRGAAKLTRKLLRARLVRIREKVVRFVLVRAVAAPAAIVNAPSALVSGTNRLVVGRDALETNTFALDKVECMMLGSLIVLAGSRGCSGRSRIAGRRRFYAVSRFTGGALFSTGAENSNHDRLYSECSAIRQSMDTLGFLGPDHFDFSCISRGTVYTVIHYSLQLLNARGRRDSLSAHIFVAAALRKH